MQGYFCLNVFKRIEPNVQHTLWNNIFPFFVFFKIGDGCINENLISKWGTLPILKQHSVCE